VNNFPNPKIELYIQLQRAWDQERAAAIQTIQHLEYQGYVYNIDTDTWEHPSVTGHHQAGK
jgi:hypothetical protein